MPNPGPPNTPGIHITEATKYRPQNNPAERT
jgi:hypothetical protein